MQKAKQPILLLLIGILLTGCASSGGSSQGAAQDQQVLILGASLDILGRTISQLADDTRILGEGSYSYNESGLSATAITLSFLTGTSGQTKVQLNEGVVRLDSYSLSGTGVSATGTIRFSSEITFDKDQALPSEATAQAQVDLRYTSGVSTAVGNLRVDYLATSLSGSLVVDGNPRANLNLSFSSYPAPGPRNDAPEDQQALVKLILVDIESALETLLEDSLAESELSLSLEALEASAKIVFETNENTSGLSLENIQMSLGSGATGWGETGLSGQLGGSLEIVINTSTRQVITSFYQLTSQNLRDSQGKEIEIDLNGDFSQGTVNGTLSIEAVNYEAGAFGYLVPKD